jgi:hypothetical protein
MFDIKVNIPADISYVTTIFFMLFFLIRRSTLIYRKRISLLFFAYVQNAIFSWDNYFVVPICYFASFSAQESQYFSMTIAPSTLNNASFVAMLPQLTQNFPFLPTSSKDLSNEKTFFPFYCFTLAAVLVATISEFLLIPPYSCVSIRT